MIAQRHRICRQILEVAVRDPDAAWPLQCELGRLHEQRLVHVIEECFSEVCSPDRVLRIDRLEVDLGPIALDDLEESFTERLGSSLRAELLRWLEEEEESARLRGEDLEVRVRLELFTSFAKTGLLPFWADAARPRLIDETLVWLLEHASGALVLLMQELGQERGWLLRIVLSCVDAHLLALLGVLRPAAPNIPAPEGMTQSDAPSAAVASRDRSILGIEKRERSSTALDLQALFGTAAAAPGLVERGWRDAVFVALLETACQPSSSAAADAEFWQNALASIPLTAGITWRRLAAALNRLLGPNPAFWPTADTALLSRMEEIAGSSSYDHADEPQARRQHAGEESSFLNFATSKGAFDEVEEASRERRFDEVEVEEAVFGGAADEVEVEEALSTSTVDEAEVEQASWASAAHEVGDEQASSAGAAHEVGDEQASSASDAHEVEDEQAPSMGVAHEPGGEHAPSTGAAHEPGGETSRRESQSPANAEEADSRDSHLRGQTAAVFFAELRSVLMHGGEGQRELLKSLVRKALARAESAAILADLAPLTSRAVGAGALAGAVFPEDTTRSPLALDFEHLLAAERTAAPMSDAHKEPSVNDGAPSPGKSPARSQDRWSINQIINYSRPSIHTADGQAKGLVQAPALPASSSAELAKAGEPAAAPPQDDAPAGDSLREVLFRELLAVIENGSRQERVMVLELLRHPLTAPAPASAFFDLTPRFARTADEQTLARIVEASGPFACALAEELERVLLACRPGNPAVELASVRAVEVSGASSPNELAAEIPLESEIVQAGEPVRAPARAYYDPPAPASHAKILQADQTARASVRADDDPSAPTLQRDTLQRAQIEAIFFAELRSVNAYGTKRQKESLSALRLGRSPALVSVLNVVAPLASRAVGPETLIEIVLAGGPEWRSLVAALAEEPAEVASGWLVKETAHEPARELSKESAEEPEKEPSQEPAGESAAALPEGFLPWRRGPIAQEPASSQVRRDAAMLLGRDAVAFDSAVPRELDVILCQLEQIESPFAKLFIDLRSWSAQSPPIQRDALLYALRRFSILPSTPAVQRTRLIAQALGEIMPEEWLPASVRRRFAAALAEHERAARPHPHTRSKKSAQPRPKDAHSSIGKRTQTTKAASSGRPEVSYLDNAGVVLLWPFLTHFFARLELTIENRFPHTAVQHRAVGLLQHAVSGEAHPEEYRLPLAKILCGMALDDVLDFGPKVTESEMDECTNLLTAVLANAPSLGELSIDNLRCAFLSRKGVLSPRDGMWLLRVERTADDVLLSELPWTLRFVKLPFMEAAVAIEW